MLFEVLNNYNCYLLGKTISTKCIYRKHYYYDDDDDVHPYPGPDADPQYRCFDKRGLHFIHVNARSLLPHIHDIRFVANQTHAACISIA